MANKPENLSERFVALQEFVTQARRQLNPHAWGYLIGGTDTEATLRRNRLSLENLALRPRVLNDVSEVDSSGFLFGQTCRLPVLLPPIGGLESFSPNGAGDVARAAAQFGVPMMLSSVSQWSIADLLKAQGDHGLALIYQLYVRDGPQVIDQIIEQAIAASTPAFCFTVDSAVYSRRERDIVARYVKPWRASGEGDARTFQASFGWKDLARIREKHRIPLVLKGIATAEDARLAVEHGVDVIYVSNHGGRQLDHGQGTMTILPEVVEAVAGRAQVIVDGGFCRGTDIVKALALGANGVGIGRLMCLALASAGALGIVRMLELLEDEFRIALALIGVKSASDLNSSHVVLDEHPGGVVSALSGFPLLNEVSAPGEIDTEHP